MSAPERESQSYLSSLNRASSRSPRIGATRPISTAEEDLANLGLKQSRGGDHRISHRRGPSSRSYPRDCPHLAVQWFHAVDIPKRKPNIHNTAAVDKPKGTPKKWSAFSKNDSRAIEAAFQKVSSTGHGGERRLWVRDGDANSGTTVEVSYETHPDAEAAKRSKTAGTIKVPVNEDFLFDVDIEERELAPAYWLGPVYGVRRGTWFQQGWSFSAVVRSRLIKRYRGKCTETVRRESSHPTGGRISQDCSMEISTTALCVATESQGIVDRIRHWQRHSCRSRPTSIFT